MATKQYQIHINLLIFLLLSFYLSLVFSRPLDQQFMLKRHEDWMSEHGRVYKDAYEKEMRYGVFKSNVERINALNGRKDRKFKLSVNKFADLTNEEFRALHTGYKSKLVGSSEKCKAFRYANLTNLPPSVDWRKKGSVTPIKDQARCGACWAFSAVAAIEGATQIKKGKLISLSEQQLVDCDTTQDFGCEGGLMDTAFQYIKSNGGLTTESNYPYIAEDGTCNTKKAKLSAATILGHEDVPENDETALMKAVASQPVSVGVEGGGFDFQFYSSGVFTGECDTYLDHAVTAIGYGTDPDGTKYWLVKNSWGVNWGEKGYMKIEKDVKAKEGLCGIAMMASYPIV